MTARAWVEPDPRAWGIRIAIAPEQGQIVTWPESAAVRLITEGEQLDESDWLTLHDDTARALHEALAQHFGYGAVDARQLRADYDAERRRVDKLIDATIARGRAMTTRRGTSNGNARGSAESRRRRREWLVETYRADVDLLLTPIGSVFGTVTIGFEHESWAPDATRVKACRCYRCGNLLTVETVTVDRIKPGCLGGTYRRDNIRPACGRCNSETGGALGAARRAAA